MLQADLYLMRAFLRTNSFCVSRVRKRQDTVKPEGQILCDISIVITIHSITIIG